MSAKKINVFFGQFCSNEQIWSQVAGPLQAFATAIALDFAVVTVHQFLRYRFAAKSGRLSKQRMAQETVLVGIIKMALRIA